MTKYLLDTNICIYLKKVGRMLAKGFTKLA